MRPPFERSLSPQSRLLAYCAGSDDGLWKGEQKREGFLRLTRTPPPPLDLWDPSAAASATKAPVDPRCPSTLMAWFGPELDSDDLGSLRQLAWALSGALASDMAVTSPGWRFGWCSRNSTIYFYDSENRQWERPWDPTPNELMAYRAALMTLRSDHGL